MTIFRRPRYGWLHSILTSFVVFCVLVVLAVLLVAWLPGVAGAVEAPTDGACYEDVELVLHEATREVVVQEEIVELEHQLAKHTRERTKDRGRWSDWSEPTVWEPLSHETWVTEIPEPDWQPHHREAKYQRDWALLPTGYSDTVLIQPQITETETDWFAQVPDGWTPTGETRTEVTTTEVDCPEPPVEEPPAEEPSPLDRPEEHECVTPDGHPYSYNDPTDGDCGIAEPPVEPTAPVEPEVTPVAAVERPATLPRTGIKEDIASAGLVLLFVGASLLGIEVYDRRHRTGEA